MKPSKEYLDLIKIANESNLDNNQIELDGTDFFSMMYEQE